MSIHYEDGSVQLWHGDCLDVLRPCQCGDETHPCDACGAQVDEPCSPFCIGMAAHKYETGDVSC